MDYALDIGLDRIQTRVAALAETLRARLQEMIGVTVRDLGRERCGIVTFTKQDETATAIQKRLSGRKKKYRVRPNDKMTIKYY